MNFQDNTNNKDKILKIALEMFSKNGYDAVGVQALCIAAEITKPTLYYYFGNKDGLLDEVLKTNYEKLNSLLAKNKYVPNPDVYEKDVFFTLTNVAECYLKFAHNNQAFYKLVLNATFTQDESNFSKFAQKYNKIQYEIIENMFKEMSAIHKNMQGSEKRLAWTFIGLINTCIALKTKDSAKSFVKQFMHGIYS